MKNFGSLSVIATLLLLAAPPQASAGSVPDCITLLNRTSSAVSEVRNWHHDGVAVRALGDNSRAIAQVSDDLAAAKSAYDKAMKCANSKEARSSRAYAAAQPRFAKDFPKHQKAIQAGIAEYAMFRTAIETDNKAKELARRLRKAKASTYEAELKSALTTLDDFSKLTTSNSFLSQRWQADVDATIRERLDLMKKKKSSEDRAETQKAMLEAAVVKRLPGMTREDAMNPRKVAEALEKTPASGYVAALMAESFVYQSYRPVKVKHPKETRLGRQYPGGKKPTTRAFVFYNQRVLFVRYTDDKLPRTEEAIPGLVWDVDEDGRVIFVSTSGGRYLSRVDHMLPASEVSGPLASGIVNGMLLHEDVEVLSERKVLKASYGRDMTASKAAYGKCADKLWKAKESAFNRLDAANILHAARQARKADLAYKVEQSVDRKCKAHLRKYSKAWDGAMREYTKLRTETLLSAQGQLGELSK